MNQHAESALGHLPRPGALAACALMLGVACSAAPAGGGDRAPTGTAGTRSAGSGASTGGAGTGSGDARPEPATDATGIDGPVDAAWQEAIASTDDAGATGGAAGAGCPTALVGFAAVAGDGVATTTGGGAATPVRPTTVDELLAYARDDSPRVIELVGTFVVPRLEVGSNKTLVGAPGGATIEGGLRVRGSASAPVRNVILRNLRVDGATTDVDGDAVQVYFAHHVWIDHLEIWDGPDGNLDLTHAVDWVTISWTKFRYTAAYRAVAGETADHRFSSLVGHSDGNAAEDEGRLKITFHHDWWAEGVLERMPRVRFGQVHVFNDYFSSTGNDYCVRAGAGAHLLVEANHFDGVRNPHEFNSPDDEKTASITARGNLYAAVTGLQETGGGGVPLTDVPYEAAIEPAAGVGARVRACAGPR